MPLDYSQFRKQEYCCCALISAINARIYLGVGTVSDEEFERLADKVRCKNGSAIGVKKVYEELGLGHVEGPYYDWDWIAEHVPVELSILDVNTYGFHSVLVVGVEDGFVYLVNNDRIGNRLTKEQMDKIRVQSPNPANLHCRSFFPLEKTC